MTPEDAGGPSAPPTGEAGGATPAAQSAQAGFDLRLAMRRWVSGVSVVAAQHAGVRHGMTVNSLSSVSLVPPIILVSLAQDTRTHALVTASGAFGVTILSQDQQDISERFAGRGAGQADRFAGLETHTLQTGSPLLAGGIAFIDGRVVAAYDYGPSTLFIAEVAALELGVDRPPLLYLNRQYRRLQD